MWFALLIQTHHSKYHASGLLAVQDRVGWLLPERIQIPRIVDRRQLL